MSSCTNARCDHGWVTVTAAYVQSHTPARPGPDVWDAMTPAEREAWQFQSDAVVAALEATVYPCKQCSPALFYRWAGGHLDPHHNRTDCDECSTPRGGRRSSTPRRVAEPEPVPEPAWQGRRDLT